jgi:GNAT superfamily N-acetyltransferase
MNAPDPLAASVRDYRVSDAESVSALFRAVYGEHYVYPDVYLPSRIHAHNVSGQWRSAVAVRDGRLLGHATLWREAAQPGLAELALNVVHPDARGQRIASRIARHLHAAADQLGVGMMTIKQVCSHPRSQHVAQALGFHSTALLIDYVESPFGQAERESIVVGCLPMRAWPLPRLDWPAPWREWLDGLRAVFGEAPPAPAPGGAGAPFTLTRDAGRVVLETSRASDAQMAEIAALPARALLDLILPATAENLAHAPALMRGGFRFGGLLPAAHDGWRLLWLRGRKLRQLQLCDRQGERLYRLYAGVA